MTPARALRGLLLALSLLHGCTAPAPSMTDARPLVIAHRGASGHARQHSLDAYRLAHAQGADLIEPDVVFTADVVPVCSHDLHVAPDALGLDAFRDRADADGLVPIPALTLDELLTLELPRTHGDGPPHHYVTLDELVLLLADLDRDAGRTTGLMLELKQPAAQEARGIDTLTPLVAALARNGFVDEDDPAWVECFDHAWLDRLADSGSTLKRVALLEELPDPARLDAALDDLSLRVQALGPARALLDGPEGEAFRRGAADRGLGLFPWTYGDERDAMARAFGEWGVAGLFTDFPDVGVAARDGALAGG